MTPRELPPGSPYAQDDGAADPGLASALGGRAAGLADVVRVLRGARVLVPVFPDVPTAEGAGTRATGAVALDTGDGRTALPVFSSVDALTRWHADARPVPVPAGQAAAAALSEGWELLVVDPAGPATAVIPGPAVRCLAAGVPWVPAVSAGSVRPDVVGAIEAAARFGAVRTVGVTPGTAAEVAVVLGVRPGLGRTELDALLAAVGRRLAATDVVAGAVDSLELRVESG